MKRAAALVGLLLLVLSVYALSGPGRIDIIDGQYRYEVTRNLIREGRPVLHDRFLGGPAGIDGRYAFYGPAASVAAMPLVWLASEDELGRFLFSFTSALLGALTMALLASFYLLLGITERRAIGWTLAVAFTTLAWPLATSTFDQIQQAFFVLLSAYCAVRSARHDSFYWALGGGLSAGIVLLYQETYVVLVPSLALFLCPPKLTLGQLRAVWRSRRAWAFFLGASLGFAAFVEFNLMRFGSPFTTGKEIVHHPLVGNPILGTLGLLVSPGKSIFLYSPPTILMLLGLRGLWRAKPAIGRAVVVMLLSHFALIACLAFYGGDWGWGPRYLVVTLPLGALGLPYLSFGTAFSRKFVVAGVLAVGLGVQLLALSVDHQRFFFARGLADFFWTDQRFYFQHSALFDRPHELGSLTLPEEARAFLPSPYPAAYTYCIFGNSPAERAASPTWMRQFAVFFLPRPWPLWMSTLAQGGAPNLPIDPARATLCLSLTALLSAAITAAAVRLRRGSETRTGD